LVDLINGQSYRFDITLGSVEDEAGNDFGGNSAYTITTVGIEDQSGGGGGGGGGSG